MKLSLKRRIVQITAFILCNLGFVQALKTGVVCPFLYCYGCPFAAFACPIGALQQFIVLGRFPLLTMGSLGVYGMVFGRFLCGWACPFGAFQDVVNNLRGGRSSQPSRYWYVKYAVLILTLTLSWLTMDTLFCKICPSGSLFASIPFIVLYHQSVTIGPYFYIHILTLILTITLTILISRFWCRYLCPLGAVAGVFNRLSLVTIELERDKCTKCLLCLEDCVMGIGRLEDIGSTDCILCGRCVEKCPQKALKITVKTV